MNNIRYLRQELEEYHLLLEYLPPTGSWRAVAFERRLQKTADRLAEELWEVSKVIAEIEEPELRLIFELRYFHGYTWAEVSEHLPTRLSADGARMKHDRYMQKLNEKRDLPGMGRSAHQFSIRKEGSAGLSSCHSS